ncbi:MAG: undecaprenyl-phosphate alpha-N-acetylglucosaminyl 1-phosphate transferase [Dethiosulfovibrio peptidovorans]|nr:MAG: undecaprenyl-phosphate alpha-N-acetylglucosaminyl 1-phosphate transferase [Dethiosulfovibrio peptidovorans]
MTWISLDASTITATVFLFLWGIGLTPLSIKLAGRFGLVDRPEPRKIHREPVPRGAGLILWAGYLFWSLIFSPAGIFFPTLITGCSMVFLVGYLDDMISLSPRLRLLVHLMAAGLVAVPFFKGALVPTILSILWIAGTTNAYNLIDGMNGLSLSMATLALAALALRGYPATTLPLVALCLGVLPWNWPKARTFLGDGGVYFLGFVVSSLTLPSLSSFFIKPGGRELLGLVFWGGVPVIDTMITIVRRLLRHRSPFLPDRGHVHHRLLDLGFSTQAVLAILSLAQVFALGVGTSFLR